MALGSHLITVRRFEKYIDDVIGKKANLPDTSKTIIGNISQINSDLTQEVSRATSQDNVLSARIDNIASLPGGSTSGDAELIDIRVGADGVTYTSAGNAVRGQVKDINNIISTSSRVAYDELNKNIITASRINEETGEVVAFNDGYIVSDKIDIDHLGKYAISLTMRYLNPVVAFYSSNDEYLGNIASRAGTQTSTNVYEFDKYEFLPPLNASYMRIGFYGVYPTDGHIYIKKYNFVSEEIENKVNTQEQNFNSYVLPNSTEIYESVNTTPLDGYILTNGELVPTSVTTWKVTEPISCEAGDILKLNATMYYNNGVVAFYNDDTKISSIIASDGENIGTNLWLFEDYEVVIPNGVNNIRCGYYTAGGALFSLKKRAIRLIDNKKWANKKWVCVGDSLTEINTTATKRYYNYVQDDTGIEVVNMGVSGTGYARQKENNKAFYQRISNCPTDADVITIFGSFNDLGAGIDVGTVDDTEPTTIAGCINKTITNLQAIIPLSNIGIVAPTPWSTTPPQTSGQAYEYVTMLKNICIKRSIPFLDLWTCSNLRPWDADFRAVAYTHDNGNGTHPDENGHKIIAPRFKAFLETLLM